MNQIKKTYLANPKYVGHIVEDRYDGATRIVVCDDSCCEKTLQKTKEVIDKISLFAVENISLFKENEDVSEINTFL